ncbi:MAG: spore germination protein, partial [Turicibacter sp.]
MISDEFQLIDKNINVNFRILEKDLGIGKSFDIGNREIVVLGRKIRFFYVTGLVDSDLIVDLLTQLLLLNNLEEKGGDMFDLIHNRLVHQQVSIIENLKKFETEVLSGLIGIIIDGETKAFTVDVRSYPGRGPSEPDTEKTVRGSRDGYTENIVINTALTRRRIRTGKLRNEIYKVGEDSKTDVVITYIEDIADPNLVNEIREKVQKINVKELTMTDKELEEFITGQIYNPYPLVRYTERPDVVATHLYQGLVGIMVDTSPSVILAPVTFFDHLTHVEEYRQTPTVGTFLRLIRMFGIIMSILIMPTWLLFVMHPEYLPDFLSFIGPQEEGNIPIILQILAGEIGIEFLRMASIHTPNAISSALGIVSALLIGQVAIDVGLFGPEILFYVAIGTVGSFITPSYELGLANKLLKLFLILCTFFLGIYGYIGGIVIGIVFLATIKSFGKPYLYPLIPLNIKELLNVLIRFPIPYRYNSKNKKRTEKR